jgi:hypothetical protein
LVFRISDFGFGISFEGEVDMSAKLTITIPEWIDKICTWPLMWYRRRTCGYDFRKISLGEGQWTIVDSKDYYRLMDYKWWVHGNGTNLYAARTAITAELRSRIIYLHRQIMDPPPTLLVDHRNTDSLDNRRANLRLATQVQNMQNRRKRKNTSSRFIGVHFDKQRLRWSVHIRHNGRKLWLGRFTDEISAARVYDKAAKEYFGEFARLNNV